MRISEFSIMRYGPLSGQRLFSLGDFNLFFGRNEDGKTLTIDALVKLLLGQKARTLSHFENIDRVEEIPEGYVIIENGDGEEIKLPERGNLAEITDLTPSEYSNIFIIRNSDLSIDNESSFYTNVTERLTGSRTERISRIESGIRKIGRITGTRNDFSNRSEDGKLKTRMQDAERLITEVEEKVSELKNEGFDKFEQESAELSNKIDEIRCRIVDSENARGREEYKKGREALSGLREALEKSQGLKIYNKADEKLWRDSAEDIEEYRDDRDDLIAERDRCRSELEDVNNELKALQEDIKALDEKKKKLDDEIKPRLNIYETERGRLESQSGKQRFLTWAAVVLGIFFIVSLAGVIIRPSILFYILSPISFTAFVVSIVYIIRLKMQINQLAEMFDKIISDAAEVGLNAESIENFRGKIREFDDEYSRKQGDLGEKKSNRQRLLGKIETLDNSISTIKNRIEKAEADIEGVKDRSKESAFEEYSAKLSEKQRYEQSAETQVNILKSLFGTRGRNLNENITYWEKQIEVRAKYEDAAVDAEYDEKSLQMLRKEAESCEAKLGELNRKIGVFRNALRDVERKANDIMIMEESEHLYCETLAELVETKEKLQEFVAENENNRDTALAAIEIFKDIETEEREKVAELFGGDSTVPKYFREITDGYYEGVWLDQEVGIKVRHRDGRELRADQLSSGAYDQLYISIRLALGEKLLNSERGFFIMDDPFIKADPERLHRQLDMLKRLSKSQWQILYFSAKGEVKEILQESISNGEIELIRVQE